VASSAVEEFGRRGGEEDVVLGRDERETGHGHRLDQVAVDYQTHFNRIGREGDDVREGANDAFRD